METGRKPGRSQVEVEASASATESLSARESHEQRPGGNTGAETAPEAATREASGTHGAVETEANPADRKTAREKIAALLWWSVPSSTDEEAKARTEQLLDAHRAEVLAVRDEEMERLRALLAAATVLEIPWTGSTLPLQLRRSSTRTDWWAICDREGRRWHREYGFVYERQDLAERERTDTRFPLADAWPLAQQIAAEAVTA